jgi:long-subunit acyl-CoA synthetase (AMP-forming)
MTTRDATTLLECFLAWERVQPNAIYLTQPHPDGRVLDYSWAQVGDEARRMAAHLRSLPIPPQSQIALLGKNSAHWIIADLAIMMAGHVSVPLYPTLSAESARYVLEHSEARLLFVGKLDGVSDNWPRIEAALPADLPLIGLPMAPRGDIPQWNEVIGQHAPLAEVHAARPDDLCTIVYTSGSTGTPKGVMHSYRSMLTPGPAFNDTIGGSSADRWLSYLPLAHVAERMLESCSLYFGMHAYFCNDLSTFVADLRRARPTVFFSVPRLWTKFQHGVDAKISPARQRWLFALPIIGRMLKRKILADLGLDHTRVAVTASAPLPSEVVRWYRNLGLELLDVYGMSENFGISHGSRPGQVRVGYVGSCHRGVEARIDANGELLVRSPGQMLGYYKLPELTAGATLADGFFRTGDRGEVDAAGRLRLTGRLKELFKSAGGKYIAPVPIENQLGSHPRLETVCVTGPGLPQPFALLVLSAETQLALRANEHLRELLTEEFTALLDHVNATLESHEKLCCVVVVQQPWTIEDGLLTPTLKIKRHAIEGRYLAKAQTWVGLRQKVVWETR